MSRAMFFGRFQPFHKGHLEVTKLILNDYDEIVFAIGMSTESHTPRNPFTAGERIEMIRRALSSEGYSLSRVITVTVPTMEVHISSVHSVIHMCPKVDAVYIGNPIVARAFIESGVKVVIPKPVKRDKYNGTLIRSLMAKGDPGWRELVPKAVAEYLDEIDACSRLKWILCPSEEHTLKDMKVY